MFLKISQISQENTCTRVCRAKACNLIKKETLAQVFSCEIYEIFKNTFFREHLQTTASELTFLKQPVIVEDEIKVSVILANKYKIKAKI